jgi:hypothetical protein
MSYTRAQIRQRIGGASFCNDMISSTASALGGSAGATLIDTTLKGNDNVYRGYEVAITSGAAAGDYRTVDSWVQSTGTITPTRAFTAQVVANTTYEMHRIYPANGIGSGLGKNQAINEAIRLAGNLWSEYVEDETLSFLSNTYLYDISALSVPVDREWLIDKVEYDPNLGLVGYEWRGIDDDLWYVRNISGTLKLQFREQFTIPAVGWKIRLTYRKRPPVLASDSATLTPNSDSFFHWVCFKATELLFRDYARTRNEDAKGILYQQADAMQTEANRYVENQAQERPKGKVILPAWRFSRGTTNDQPIHTDRIHIEPD